MSNIIQQVSITKHINPSKQISDEYTLMITYRDVVYITKIKEESFESNLFEFDMLEQLIYNCNHKQKVGDVLCDMNIKETESFGKVLDITLIFERDVRPMKKIQEEHEFQLQEKKLDYDDKIGLAINNLRSEINFVEIKPTTKIVKLIIDELYKINTNDIYIEHIKLYTLTSYTGHYLKVNIQAIVFIDETKKPNNRKIKFYKSIEEFEKQREQFKTYHIIDMTIDGLLIEQIN
jgi:hypothetical protein